MLKRAKALLRNRQELDENSSLRPVSFKPPPQASIQPFPQMRPARNVLLAGKAASLPPDD